MMMPSVFIVITAVVCALAIGKSLLIMRTHLLAASSTSLAGLSMFRPEGQVPFCIENPGRAPNYDTVGDCSSEECHPVLVPLTSQARKSLGKDMVILDSFPFRFGREARCRMVSGRPVMRESRSEPALPDNDLFMLNLRGSRHISREHFQIEQKADGSFEILDRGSTCGTIVDNRVLGQHHRGGRHALTHGSHIVVGSSFSPYAFRFLTSQPEG